MEEVIAAVLKRGNVPSWLLWLSLVCFCIKWAWDFLIGVLSEAEKRRGRLGERQDRLGREIDFLEGKDPEQRLLLMGEWKALSLERRHGIRVPAALVERVESLSENHVGGYPWGKLRVISEFLRDDGEGWLKVVVGRMAVANGWISIVMALPMFAVSALLFAASFKIESAFKNALVVLGFSGFFLVGLYMMVPFFNVMLARKMSSGIEKAGEKRVDRKAEPTAALRAA